MQVWGGGTDLYQNPNPSNQVPCSVRRRRVWQPSTGREWILVNDGVVMHASYHIHPHGIMVWRYVRQPKVLTLCHPGIKPGDQRWQHWILPINHWHFIYYDHYTPNYNINTTAIRNNWCIKYCSSRFWS